MKQILFSNLCFLILLIQFGSISLMKTSYSKFPVFVQKNKKESRCDGYYSSTERVRSLISATTNLSLNNTSKYYFLIFTNSFSSLKNVNNKFENEAFDVFSKLFDFKFYCSKIENDKSTTVHVLIINNGQIIEDKRLSIITDEYINYIFQKFNLKEEIAKEIEKFKQALSAVMPQQETDSSNVSFIEKKKKEKKKNRFVQISSKSKKFYSYIFAEKKENRLTRFIWSFLMVLVFSISIFFFVKYSIDWATASKTELNKMKDQKLREITDILLSKEFLKEEEL